MRKIIELAFILIFLSGCALNYRTLKTADQPFEFKANDSIFFEKKICKNVSCFKSNCEIQEHLISLLKTSFQKRGFIIENKKEGASVTIKVMSLFKTKYKGQLPRNLYISIWRKKDNIEYEKFQFALAKQYNGRFLNKSMELNKALTIFLSNFVFQEQFDLKKISKYQSNYK